ncbi:MAG: hypothetical protein ACFE75_06905 [Candidatus Hodarchaeota archaeon]
MVNKRIIAISTMVVLGFSLTIAFPIVFLSTTLAPYGIIHEGISFKCAPHNISSIEELNLNIDIGNIQINYVDPQVEDSVKLDINFDIIGSDVAGKSYLEYFSINWQNTSSSLNFTMELLSDNWFDPSKWVRKNIEIIISVRKDITLDILTTVNEGDFKIKVPWGVSIGKVFTNITNGDIFYDFYHCTIGSNITGITKNGDIKLNSLSLVYTQNINWNLNTEVGDIYLEIDQDNEMGANITGLATINTGNFNLNYKDDSTNIGALFAFPISEIDIIPLESVEGFDIEYLGVIGYLYKSFDFPTKNNYNLSFYITGIRIIDIISD